MLSNRNKIIKSSAGFITNLLTTKLYSLPSSSFLLRSFSVPAKPPVETKDEFVINPQKTEAIFTYFRHLQTAHDELKRENEKLKKQLMQFSGLPAKQQTQKDDTKTRDLNYSMSEIFDYLSADNRYAIYEIGAKLATGADANFLYINDSPLMLLVARLDFNHHSKKIAELLFQYGASVNLQNNSCGKSALHRAVEKGKIGWVDYLIEKGADVTLKDFANETPLEAAISPTKRVGEDILVSIVKAERKQVEQMRAYRMK